MGRVLQAVLSHEAARLTTFVNNRDSGTLSTPAASPFSIWLSGGQEGLLAGSAQASSGALSTTEDKFRYPQTGLR